MQLVTLTGTCRVKEVKAVKTTTSIRVKELTVQVLVLK